MATDNSTIIGVFDRYSTAEQAARKLAETGIPQEAIQIRSEMKTEAAGRSRFGDEGDSGGGISGFFRRIFGADTPDEHLNRLTDQYSDVIGRGGALVCVSAGSAQVDQAVEVMNQYGAIDVDDETGSTRTMDEDDRSTGTVNVNERGASSRIGTSDAGSQREQSGASGDRRAIPVIEEELQVGKRVIRRGGVRVYSQVIEQPVEEEIALREEHVHVERRPVDRPVTAEDESSLREQSFEVTETAEEPVVSKRSRVKEEVVVGKDATERKEKVRDTVRHTEVKVEQMSEPQTATATNYSDDFRRDFQTNYAASGGDYSTMQPAYEYGYAMANDPRYKGKSWNDVESQLKTDYLRRSPNSTWDKTKGAVRYGWERVTGQR